MSLNEREIARERMYKWESESGAEREREGGD